MGPAEDDNQSDFRATRSEREATHNELVDKLTDFR